MDDNKKHCLKVFVGSPGDVSAEREIVSAVIEELNNELDSEGVNVLFQPILWEKYPYLRDTRRAPQVAIAEGIPRPRDCEVAVFIFWNRIGTVLDMKGLEPNKAGETPTGSTWEFYDAFESKTSRLMLTYRKTATAAKPPNETGAQARERMALELAVIDFFESELMRGANDEYLCDPHEFKDSADFTADLEKQLRKVARNYQPTDNPEPVRRKPATDLDIIPAEYLNYLREKYQHIDLGALSSGEPLATRLPLIYVPALTTRSLRADDDNTEALRQLTPDRSSHETLLNRLGKSSLYVSGNAGQGKSTFCQWLMLIMANAGVPAMPLDEECEAEYRETLPDSLVGRLPLLLRLSEFWRGLKLEPGQTELSCHQLEQGLCQWLDQQRPGGLSAAHFRHHLDNKTLLLLLDGVDEVPESDGATLPRPALLNGLTEALIDWTRRGVRVLLTSRPYGLTRSQAQALALEETPLALLPWSMQVLFVKRWFGAAASQAKVDTLLEELKTREDLRELRENPLLLTAVCVKYHNQKQLPQDIHDLYQSIVDQVLYSRFKGGRNDRDAIARRLEVIALGMHCGSKAEPRTLPVRDIALSEVDRHLANYAEKSPTQEGGAEHASKRREELLSRSGLLLNRADDRAGFFHWTFQDYFAAQRLQRENKSLATLLTEHAAQVEWRNALRMLLARMMAERDADGVLAELEALREQITPETLSAQPEPALLLGKLLEIVHFRTKGNMGDWCATLKQVCLDSLKVVDDPAVRNELFTDLAVIGGDDRRGVGLNDKGLPDIDWVEIPAGPFPYGEKKKNKIKLEGFAISRYLVTHVQFQAFIDAGGYAKDQPWWQQDLQHKPLESAYWPYANRPRETVSWYDAMAFCRWLSHLTGKTITLPTEKQWEKAARGEKGREYPWGDGYQSGYANCNEKRSEEGPFYLEQTTAVGLYPQGRSPYGIEDMAGNVWEWTADFYNKDKDSYALRGGSWNFDPDSLRAARRVSYDPDNRPNEIGFRVVCAPHQ